MLQTSTLRKRSNLSRTIAALIASGGLFFAAAANAADGTWLGVNGSWSAAGTWAGGTIADGADFTANFTGVDINGARTITIGDLPRTIGNIIFTDATTSSHNLTISGAQILTLDVTSGASTLSVTQSGRTMTISSVIAGDDAIQKTGAGILLLSGANTFSGQLSVQSGVLQVASLNNASTNGVLGNSASSVILGSTGSQTGTLNYTGTTTTTDKPFTLAAGGTGAFNVSAANTNTITLSGLIDGSGNLTKLGNANLKLTGANTYTGVTTVTAGRLDFESDANVANPNPLGQSSADASNLLLGNGTTLRFLGSTAASIDRNFTINGTAANHGATIDSSGTAPISYTNTASPAYGVVDQTRALTLGGTNTDVNTFAANIGNNGIGAVSLNKSGNGVWYVSGNNTNTGQTNLSGGVMVLASATALPSSGLRFTNGAVLGLASGDFTRISGAAATPAAGTFSFGSDGGFAAYGADRMVNMGGAGGNVAFGSTANATVASLNGKAMVLGATTATHTLIWMNGLDSGTVTRTLSVVDGLAAVDAEIRGVLTSTVEGAGLIKNGTGTLLLSNANTLIGPLNINAGKVMVSNPSALGAGSPTNIVTVANDAVLDLNGTNLTIATPLNLSGTGIGGTGSLINSSTSGGTYPGLVTFANAAVRIDGAGTINLSNAGTITGPDTALTLAGAGGNVGGGLQTGAGSLMVNSTGTWTLNGVSNFTGATAVDGGTLALAGLAEINGTSGITVNAASAKLLHAGSVAMAPVVTLTQGTVTGSGTINTVNVGAGTGGIVSNNNGVPGASLTIGTLTFNGAATVNTFSSSTSAPIVTTALATDLAGSVTINPSSLTWADNTTHNLISYAGGSIGGTGGFGQFTLGTVSGLSARQVASALGNSGTAITLTITGDTPYWTGDGDDTWNLSSTNNWKLVTAGTATTFLTNDNVLFNDNATGAGPISVNIDTANVAPNSTVFNNSTKNYVLNNTGGFGISTGSVVKSGTGILTINNANTYTGGTTVNAGTLQLGNANALGTGTLTINGGNLDSSVANLVNAGNNTQLWNGDFTFVGAQNLNLGTGPVTLSGNRIVTVTANNLTVGGSIGGGSASLTKLGAGTLTLAGGGTFTGTLAINAGTVALTPASAGAFTLSNAISGTGTLSVDPFAANSSNVTLGGDLTGFTGTVNIATSGGFNSKLATTGASSSFGGGTVVNVASGGTWYSTASQSGITVNLFGTGNSENLGALRMDNATLDGTSSVVLKSDSAIGGTGTTTINAPISQDGGTFGYTKQGTGTFFITGTNTYGGLTTVSAGSLVVQNIAALGTTAGGTVVADGGRVELENLTITGEALTIAGAGGNNLGSLQGRSGTNVWTGPVTVTADLTRIGAANGASLEVSGVIDDGMNDYRIRFRPQSATATVIVSGANTYTGGTSIIGGPVVASSLNKVVGGTASSSFGAPVTAANGMIILGLSGTANNGTLSYVGAGETTDRTIQIGDNSATPVVGDNGAGAIENNGATGALVFNSPIFNSPTNAVTGTSPARTLTLGGTNTAANTISGIIQNNQIAGNPTAAVAITKAGSGTWVFGGANTYTGTTTINEGKLLINGNNTAATGPVNVNASAILGGSGIVGGLTTVNTGFVAPGNSAGNLTFANGLDLAAAGVYSWELGALSVANPGTDFDTITISGGNLALGSSSTLTLDFGLVSANDPNSANPFWTSLRTWKIVDVTGTGTNTGDTNISTITNATYTSGSFTTTVGAGGDTGDIFLVFTPTVVGASTWIGASGDNWTAGTSWTGSVPNSATAEAQFTTTGGAIANLDVDQTVNKLTFDATTSNDYTISGPGELTLAGTTPSISLAATNTGDHTIATNVELGAGTTITVSGGSLSLNVPTTNAVLGAGVTATVASGATLSLGGTGNALSNGTSTHANVANSGTLTATTAGKRVGEISGSGTTTVTTAGATLTANHIRQATLNIGAGNTVTVAANGGNSGTSVVTNLNINATGKLDLNDNDLVVDNGNLATLTAQLATGLDINGTYGNGPGITSTAFANNVDFNTVLGIAANVELGYTSFSGQTVDANDVLIKYTYYGDADLSGSVDTSTDFDLYITGLTSGGSLGGWLYGDFDYSGTVDSSTDFDLYITGLTSQGGPLLTAGGGGNLVQAVPEPSTFVLGGLALLGFAGVGIRRRRMALQQA